MQRRDTELTPEQITWAREQLIAGKRPRGILIALGCGRSTLYRAMGARI